MVGEYCIIVRVSHWGEDDVPIQKLVDTIEHGSSQQLMIDVIQVDEIDPGEPSNPTRVVWQA